MNRNPDICLDQVKWNGIMNSPATALSHYAPKIVLLLIFLIVRTLA